MRARHTTAESALRQRFRDGPISAGGAIHRIVHKKRATGAGDRLAAALPNPGTYDLSVHGPNGFFRQFAGSSATVLRVDVETDDRSGIVRVRISGGRDSGDRHRRGRPISVNVADAYGPDRRVNVPDSKVITIDTRRSGGWYDIALSTPSDASFSYQLAGQLESRGQLTSDPQLER